MTPRQKEYMKYLREFYKDNDQLPPVSIIADNFDITGNAAHEMLARLCRDGHIEKNIVGKWRFSR